MDEPDWDRIEEIYHEARKLPPDQRKDFVKEAAGDDPFVMRSVLELLEAAGSEDHILDKPIALGLPSSADQLVGQTIGERYFIERELGGGGMGEVYLAQDRRLHDLPVVIKFLARELGEDSYARQKFKQESEALSRIKHAGVVRVLDNNEHAGRPYFVMEFIDGETLRSQIQSGGMNLRRAATILKQIGAALDHAHQQGVIHRDLKPENILLRRGTDEVVLIDFGIAKVRESVIAPTTTHGPTAGTVKYMSPEQLRGQEVTPASDIYSMAVIAYEMVTGQRPFNTDSAARLSELQKKRVRVKPRRLREDLPADAEAMILRALKFDPSARHERAGEFGDSLAGALVDRSVAPPVPWPKVIRAALVITIGIMIIIGVRKIIYPPPPPEPNRSFTYYLMVQRMRDGQPYGEPYKSHGEEPYSTGDRFQVTVSTPVPAYLYIFREGPPEDKETGFKLLYPRRTTNNGSASLGANQPVQTDWYSFEGLAAAENFWFVWSTSPVGELDAAISEALKHPKALLTDQTLIAVRQFLTTKEAEIDAKTYNYKDPQDAVVRGRHDLLVTLAQFRHR